APGIESRQAESARPQILVDDARNQEAGDDEEDIDADEAAVDLVRKGMKSDDQQHSDCAQPVDVTAVLELHPTTPSPRAATSALGRNAARGTLASMRIRH